MLTGIQEEVFNLFSDVCSIAIDEIENAAKFDFANNIGVYYNASSIIDMEYKSSIPLIITLVSVKLKKIEMHSLAETIDLKLNKVPLSNGRIVRQNTYFNEFIDDEGLNNIVLSYYINKY